MQTDTVQPASPDQATAAAEETASSVTPEGSQETANEPAPTGAEKEAGAEQGGTTAHPTEGVAEAQGEDFGIENFIERFVGRKRRVTRRDAPRKEKMAVPDARAVEAKKAEAEVAGEIARAVAEGVLSGLTGNLQAGAATGGRQEESGKPPERGQEWLTDEERETLAVLERLEKEKPDRYSGLPKRYEAALKSALEYKEKWEKEHPGEEFDPESEEHSEALAKIEEGVDWDDGDYERALVDLRAEKIAERKLEKAKAEISNVRREMLAKEHAPSIYEAQARAAKNYFGIVGDEFSPLTGNGAVDTKKVETVVDRDPIAASIVFENAAALERAVTALEEVTRGITSYNPKDELHRAIAQVITEQEAAISRLPPEKRLRDGRDFLPGAVYDSLPPEQRSRYWRLHAEDIERIMTQHFAEVTRRALKQHEDQLRKLAQRRGWLPSEQEAEQNRKRAELESLPHAVRVASTAPIAPPPTEPIGTGRQPSERQRDSFIERFLNGT